MQTTDRIAHMSKKFKIFIGLAVLALGLFVSSGKVTAASPWDNVWAEINEIRIQIADLYEQIATIELLPGPTGVPGPTGQQGIQGQQGPAGPGINKDLMYVATSAETFIYPRGGLYTFVTVRCHDNNDPLFSGGYHFNPDPGNYTHILSSAGSPTDGTAGWTVGAYSDAPNDLSPGSIFVEAYCLRVD